MTGPRAETVGSPEQSTVAPPKKRKRVVVEIPEGRIRRSRSRTPASSEADEEASVFDPTPQEVGVLTQPSRSRGGADVYSLRPAPRKAETEWSRPKTYNPPQHRSERIEAILGPLLEARESARVAQAEAARLSAILLAEEARVRGS